MTMNPEDLISDDMVELVAYTVKKIAETQGFATYPKSMDVKRVLQGLVIASEALKTKEALDGEQYPHDNQGT